MQLYKCSECGSLPCYAFETCDHKEELPDCEHAETGWKKSNDFEIINKKDTVTPALEKIRVKLLDNGWPVPIIEDDYFTQDQLDAMIGPLQTPNCSDCNWVEKGSEQDDTGTYDYFLCGACGYIETSDAYDTPRCQTLYKPRIEKCDCPKLPKIKPEHPMAMYLERCVKQTETSLQNVLKAFQSVCDQSTEKNNET